MAVIGSLQPLEELGQLADGVDDGATSLRRADRSGHIHLWRYAGTVIVVMVISNKYRSGHIWIYTYVHRNVIEIIL